MNRLIDRAHLAHRAGIFSQWLESLPHTQRHQLFCEIKTRREHLLSVLCSLAKQFDMSTDDLIDSLKQTDREAGDTLLPFELYMEDKTEQ